jgi:peroxiredoxin
MIKNENRNAGTKGAKLLAAAAALVITFFLFWSFAGAVADGFEWKYVHERAMLRPDFEELDESAAKRVPDFTLNDRYGNPVRLSRFSPAEVLLINVWSSGCPVCETEIPSLSEMDRRLSSLGRVALITITVDEKWDEVASYFPYGTDLRVLFDPTQKVAKEIFGTTKYPETFVLDSKRRIRARFDGERDWHSREMLKYIESFM